MKNLLGILVAGITTLAFLTPDAEIGLVKDQVPGFLAVEVEDVLDPTFDKNKVDKDLLTKYHISINHIVAFSESPLSSKKIPRTDIVVEWYSAPLVVPGHFSRVGIDIRQHLQKYADTTSVIGNSPFPRFGDELNKKEKEHHDPKDKGHPDKVKKDH